MWVGTDGGGVNVLKKGARVFSVYAHSSGSKNRIGSDYVLAIYEDKQKRIWTGNFKGGLSLFDRTRGSFRSIPQFNRLSVSTILQARNGILWLGTFEEGLFRYDPVRDSLTHYPANADQPGALNCPIVLTLWEEATGNIWVGTEGGGVNVFRLHQNKFTQYKHDSHNPQKPQ